MAKRVSRNREAIEAEENLVVDAHLLIQRLLVETKMTRADLAKAMGVSQARLSQVMAVDANPTLRTLANIFFAMGKRLMLEEGSSKSTATAGSHVGESKADRTTWYQEREVLFRNLREKASGRDLAERREIARRQISVASCNDNRRGWHDIKLPAAS